MARPKPTEKMTRRSIYLPKRLADAMERKTDNTSKYICELLEEAENTL